MMRKKEIQRGKGEDREEEEGEKRVLRGRMCARREVDDQLARCRSIGRQNLRVRIETHNQGEIAEEEEEMQKMKMRRSREDVMEEAKSP
jgi:hypothetical protein